MNTKLRFVGILALLAVCLQAWSDESKLSLGLYVVVDNMAESKTFYRELFDSDPYVDNGDFVGFSVSGSLFALFARSSFEHSLVRGNSVVPYIRVGDIAIEFERIKSLGAKLIHKEIVEEGPIRLFMFTDPSGNPIEFYSLP